MYIWDNPSLWYPWTLLSKCCNDYEYKVIPFNISKLLTKATLYWRKMDFIRFKNCMEEICHAKALNRNRDLNIIVSFHLHLWSVYCMSVNFQNVSIAEASNVYQTSWLESFGRLKAIIHHFIIVVFILEAMRKQF